MRSRSFALLVNKADDAEVAEALKPEILDYLDQATAGALAEQQPAEPQLLFAHVGAVVRLIGQNWAPANRTEYTAAVVQELADMPGAMVLDALTRARRNVTDGRLLVKWVCDSIDPKATALSIEVDRYLKLCTLATPAA